MASLTMSVSWVGMIFGGWWTDRLALRYGRRIGRALPISFSRFMAMAAFLVALFTEMYGFPFTQPFPDLERTNCLVITGANPVMS